MFHSVIIASLNRPDVLAQTLEQFTRQTIPPDEIVVSVSKPQDLPAQIENAKVVSGPVGSSIQRNTGLAAIDSRCDLVSFFDDDVELDPQYCEQLRALFEHDASLLGCTGHVIADGTGNGGVTREEARKKIAALPTLNSAPVGPLRVEVIPSLYGCNMNVRRHVTDTVRFDERMAGYAWLEDVEFSLRVGALGKLVFTPDCRLVHLATPTGRASGVRMGISQIINPLYIHKKGVSKSLWRTIYHSCFLRIVANLAGVVLRRNAVHVDRVGRLKGNFIALGYVLRGKIDPEIVSRYS